MAADLYGTRNAYLGCHDRVFADFHVVGNLYQIIYFGAAMYNRCSHGSPVNTGIGTYVYFIFQNNDSDLWNLIIPVRSGSESESVGSDYRAGM